MASANLMNSYKRVQIYLRTKGHAEMRKSMKRTPKKNYDELSRQILEEIGGKDNTVFPPSAAGLPARHPPASFPSWNYGS